MNNSKNVVVLLIEDNPIDQESFCRALKNQEMIEKLYVVASAEKALDYLNDCKSNNPESPRPNLILLDLDLPGIQGRDFLKLIKDDDDLCSIPVVILTSSDNEADIKQSYKLQAAGYAQKPVSSSELEEVVGKVLEYWLTTSTLI